jgi:hypothetical protein
VAENSACTAADPFWNAGPPPAGASAFHLAEAVPPWHGTGTEKVPDAPVELWVRRDSERDERERSPA